MTAPTQVVVVDHHDSYTWNLVHLVAAVTGTLPAVVQHDEVTVDDLRAYSHLVLSPGPGRPDDPADFSLGRAVFELGRPVLGVCLGMQALVTAYGGQVAPVEPAHGELALVRHDGRGVLTGLPDPFTAVRYHSLATRRLPDVLEETAWCEGPTGPVVMGVRHRSLPLEGVQFHPESVLSEHGRQLVATFLGRDVSDLEDRFTELAGRDRVCWLDGGGSRAWSGRRSILGALDDDDVSLTYDASAREVRRHRGGAHEVVGDDVFTVLAEELARDAGDPRGGWVGYLGYACHPDLPATPATPATTAARGTGGTGGVPDAVWMRLREPVFVDHPDEPVPPARTPAAAVGPVPAHYAAAFAEVQRQLRLGNSYEVNLTYREELRSAVDPVTAYLRLRAASPAPYAGFLRHHGVHLLSSSPERFATVGRDGWVETRPIKGTTPRGSTVADDEAHRVALATDPKFRAENLMVVDLLRNDLSMVCEPGTVTVPSLMAVETYTSVHQLVSTVRGRLRDGVGTVDALRALFPAGSMTGAPKRRTMEVIEAVEGSPRGVYAGAFGWIGADGRADLGVVIRSLVATAAGTAWRYELGTGGGITVRSDLAEEWAETRWKAERLRSVLHP